MFFVDVASIAVGHVVAITEQTKNMTAEEKEAFYESQRKLNEALRVPEKQTDNSWLGYLLAFVLGSSL